ncbi:T6SS effector amidase Tae4 family protein [Lysobacter arvi]|uniref:T6SS effector amidase Tae4 family protein n=1 Tax=Lysobacter arvi TaxID=3038776 RepID=A0ABU1C8C6_9GAMM|nr:T6SS effector amidase Tae4 family protein [Lysobacter arvi]MDR0181436.1 T6SS effector amidase Tae4 family protein [Lysobacter arvi]
MSPDAKKQASGRGRKQMIDRKEGMLSNLGRKWLAVLVLFLAVSCVQAQTQFPLGSNGWMGLGNRNGDFFIVQDDLQVKVPGGYVRINRDYDGRQWVFNRQWSGLGRPSYNKAFYPSMGAFFSCTIVDGVSSCDSTASSGSSIQFGNPENDVQQTRIPNDPFFGRNVDGSPAPDPYLDQFVARMGVGFTRSSDGTSWVSSKHPRFVLRPQQVPALPVSAGPDAHPGSGRPGKGGIATVQVNGFRWTDRSGSWIEYDNLGRITSYGDRNDVRVWMQYGAHGQVERVLDDNGRTVFTLLYSNGSADFITEVRDHTPFDGNIRRVKYQYDGDGRLRNVVDARGNTTSFDYGSLDSQAYDYNGGFGAAGSGGSGAPIGARASSGSTLLVDTRRKVTKVTDAEGRVTEIGYGVTARVGRVMAPDGGLTEFDYGYDKLKKEFSVTVRHPQTEAGRRIETSYYDQEGRVARREVNGKLSMAAQGSRSSMTYTDEQNNTTRIDRNNFDEVTRLTNADGSSLSITYEAASLDPREVVDPAGSVTKLEYDAKGNLLKLTAAAGMPEAQTTEYQPNARGEPELVRRKGGDNPDGSADPDVDVLLQYDTNGNIGQLIDGEGKVWKYEYDSLGNLTRTIDPLGHEWTYTYDAHGNRLSATDPNGLTSQFAYDKTDRLRSLTDPRGKVYSVDYDATGRPKRMTDPTGDAVTLEYDQAGQLTATSDAMNQRVALAYDGMGRISTVTDGNGNVTTLEYTDVSGADRGGELVSRINYPTLQRLLRYNNRKSLTQMSEVVDGDVRSTSLDYDLRGLLKAQVNPYEKSQGVEHDALGRQTSATDELGATVRLAYDHRNNLISVTDELGQVTRMEYDRRDRLVRQITAENEVTLHRYDDAGRLQEVVRPNGYRLSFRFDNGGRLQMRQSHRPDGSVELTDSFVWDDGSRLTGWTSGSASRNATFDDADRLLSETVTVDGVPMSRQYTYYANGQVKSFTGPDGSAVTYSYDGNGSLDRVDIPGEGSISVAERQWVESTKVVLPGGAVQEIERNGLMSQTRLRVRAPSQSLVFEQSSRYGKQEEVVSRSTQGRQVDYRYDEALRLVEADPVNWSGKTETYALDAADNRLNDHEVADDWEYDKANRLLKRGGVTYQYDAAGNLIVKVDASLPEPRRTTRYAYDGYNRLIELRDGASAVLARYSYDPFGYRLSKEVTAAGASNSGAEPGERLFLQAEEGLLAEVKADGAVLQSYGWRPSSSYSTGPLFMRNRAGYFYYHNDPLGQPRQLTDKNGLVVWEAAGVSSFGRTTIAGGATVEQPWRLPGQYYDRESGLHYNLHRYYDPNVGRYTTADPLGFSAGANFYAYVFAIPTALIDPLGLLRQGLPHIGPPTLRDGDDAPRVGPQRPDSSTFFENYPRYKKVGQEGYESSEVWELVGGPLAKEAQGNPNYTNSCAARVSYALNKSGAPIPRSTPGAESGADGLYYLIRARDMNAHLHRTLGAPDTVLRTRDELNAFWSRLRPGEVAIVATTGHVAVLRHGYHDPYVADPLYLGETWKLNCGCN